mgnify:CR=1 FL=1
MRKLLLFFVALLATTILWARPFQVGDLYYKVPEDNGIESLPFVPSPGAGRTTVVLYVPENTPAGCYAVGSVNGWDVGNTDFMFTPVEGTGECWVACTFDYALDMQIKVIAIPSHSDYPLDWSFQWGKNMDYDEGNVVVLEGTGYLVPDGDSPKLVELADDGVVYIEIKDWANDPYIEPIPCESAAFRHPWGGGDWVYREATKTADATFELNARYGDNGVRVATDVNDNNSIWYSEDQIEFVGDVALGDSVNFKFVSEIRTLGRMIVTLIEKGTGLETPWYTPSKKSPTVPQKRASTDSRRKVVVTYQSESSDNYAYLTTAYIPETFVYKGTTYEVVGIDDGAFANSPISSITIPNSVTSIGNGAFAGCKSLTSITIPNSVTNIGSGEYKYGFWEGLFSGCSSLKSIIVQDGNLVYDSRNNCNAIVETATNTVVVGCQATNMPSSITSIGPGAFAGHENLTSIYMPTSITNIGHAAFQNCSALTSITIPNSVTSIGDEAFAYCYSLTSIYWNAKRYTDFISYSDAPFFAISSQITSFNFGDSVNYIPAYLCHGMNRLAFIAIGRNVQELADSVFYNCNRIDTILIKALTPPVLRENVFSSKAICEIPCVSLHHYELSPWKEYAYSFETDPFNQSFLVQSNNDKMGVVDIVQYPDCGIPAIIKTVPAFGYRFVQWNDGNTDSLRTIFVDKDTCLVAEFALSYSGQCGENLYWSYDNSKLNINGSGTMNHFESTDKPWLLFNDSIITIDISLGATTIGKNAFADQIKLNTVILPYTLEDIGDKAFDGCRRLYNIYCYAAIPPIAELTSFMNYNAQLYIPCEALELYKSDMVFGEFDNL